MGELPRGGCLRRCGRQRCQRWSVWLLQLAVLHRRLRGRNGALRRLVVLFLGLLLLGLLLLGLLLLGLLLLGLLLGLLGLVVLGIGRLGLLKLLLRALGH